jgi:hypothetical protein
MFLSEHGSRLSARAVQHLVHKWCLSPQRGTDSCAPAQALVRDQDGERRYVLRGSPGAYGPQLIHHDAEVLPHSAGEAGNRIFRGDGIHQREMIMVAKSAASAVGGGLPLTAHERGMMFGKNQPDGLNEKSISLATPSPGYLLHVPSKPK